MSALGKFAQQIAQAVTDGIGSALSGAVKGVWNSFLQFFYGFVCRGLGDLFSEISEMGASLFRGCRGIRRRGTAGVRQ